MAKINDTTTYPITTPASGDLLIGTDVSNTTNDANGETVNFTASSILALSPTASEFVEIIEPDGTSANIDISMPSTSTFGGVVLELSGIGHGSGTDRQLTIQFSTDGGSTFLAGTNYNSIGATGASTATDAIYLTENVDNTSGIGISGEIKIHGFDRSDVRCSVTSNLLSETSTPGSIGVTTAGGQLNANTVVTDVRLSLGGQNIRDGHIIVRANKKV